MKFKKVLLLYKRSAYRIYFLEKTSSLHGRYSPIIKEEKRRFEESHVAHYDTLQYVAKVLFAHGIRFEETYRGRSVDYSKYDLIITVGGDGTFLEAAKNSRHQVIIGVNSAPAHSVGRFCIANKNNFEKVMQKIVSGHFKTGLMHRLRLVRGRQTIVEALNDVLICHSNPAFLCRYYLKLGRLREEQRSSGVWVSTPAGSTGAIHSAGGKILDEFTKKFQYMPRELYRGKANQYKLKGSVLEANQSLEITSLMRKGAIFVDGAHHHFPFEYASNISISLSPHPIRTIRLK